MVRGRSDDGRRRRKARRRLLLQGRKKGAPAPKPESALLPEAALARPTNPGHQGLRRRQVAAPGQAASSACAARPVGGPSARPSTPPRPGPGLPSRLRPAARPRDRFACRAAPRRSGRRRSRRAPPTRPRRRSARSGSGSTRGLRSRSGQVLAEVNSSTRHYVAKGYGSFEQFLEREMNDLGKQTSLKLIKIAAVFQKESALDCRDGSLPRRDRRWRRRGRDAQAERRPSSPGSRPPLSCRSSRR